jgi:hypothetical protein
VNDQTLGLIYVFLLILFIIFHPFIGMPLIFRIWQWWQTRKQERAERERIINLFFSIDKEIVSQDEIERDRHEWRQP